jgi:anti-anti-sigma factor
VFTTGRQGAWLVVHPVGEIDLAVAGAFRDTVLDAVSRADQLAIDFSQVTFLDSSGLSVIATAITQSKDRGVPLVLVGLSERIRMLLEIPGMTKILDIRDRLAAGEEFAVEWMVAQSDLTSTA